MLNFIKSFSRKYAVIFSIAVSFICIGFILSVGILISKTQPSIEYLPLFIQEVLGLIVALFFLKACDYMNIFSKNRKNFLKGLFTAGYFIVMGIYTIFIYMTSFTGEKTLRPAVEIVFFVLSMFSVGAFEEILFRGIVVPTLLNKFSTSRKGIFITCAIDGIIFGLAHSSNLIGGAINPVGVFVQVIVTGFMGAAFCALYLRTGCIWLLMFLHGFNDICGLFTGGLYTSANMITTISSYDLIKLVAVIPYTIVLLILLRKNKISTIEENFAEILDKKEIPGIQL